MMSLKEARLQGYIRASPESGIYQREQFARKPAGAKGGE